MIALIDLYGKELLKVNGFYPSTVETYLISIKAFCGFVKDELKVGPDRIKGPHLIIWMRHLKHAGAGQSRMEHHHYALKSFFGFLEKSGRIRKNPADVMPLMINRKRNRTKNIPASDAFTLLTSFDQNTWHIRSRRKKRGRRYSPGNRTNPSRKTGYSVLSKIRQKPQVLKQMLRRVSYGILSPLINFQYYLKNQRQNCGASINRKIFALRSYGNYLKLYDVPLTDTLPFYDVLKIRQGYRKRPGALTPTQIRLLFKTIDCRTILGIRDYAVYALMYQLGLRVGEVHALNLANMDFENSKINVLGKGQKPRTLHMNDELIEILCQYMAVRELFCNSRLTPALFVSKKGNRPAIRTMEDNFKNILLCSSLNVPFNVTCHTLRHSSLSLLINNFLDILKVLMQTILK